ncbi:MAG: alpha-L-fucosidase [Puniceicoccales bacterium]|jgi:alpha-L-fucosidase|nr:alpha-L-fucosidase [Puniceicoccales bacterium]
MKKKFLSRTLSTVLTGISVAFVAGAPASAGEAGAEAPVIYEPKWSSLDKRPAPEWFRDAKFGIFIHWGLYSVPSWAKVGEYAEWYWTRLGRDSGTSRFQKGKYGTDFKYEDFAPLFKAELFNASSWAKLFKKAGARYVVPTSKHHEGYALWPSAEASKTWGRPWNAAEVGPMRDLLGEIAKAVRDEGMKFGFYISLYEWNNPLWRKNRNAYVTEHFLPQFKDAVLRYKPSLLFGDGEWDMPSSQWKTEEFMAWLYNESPSKDDVIINDRWGKETRHRHGGYFTTEYGAGLADGSKAWEENRGIGRSFGLNRAERVGHYKSSRELVLVLADLVSRGGNLLLNVGPAADGTIPPIMEERLLDIGAWLNVNGEAIYETRSAGRPCQWTEGKRPEQRYGTYKVKYDLMDYVGQRTKQGKEGLKAVKQVFFTQKKNTLYAISVGWPGATLTLRDVKTGDKSVVSLLGRSENLEYTRQGDDIVIKVPSLEPDALPCQYAYTFKITDASVLPETDAGKAKAAEIKDYKGES